jgi:hypothetical protein
VTIPASVTGLQLPEGVRIIDARSAPTETEVPVKGVQRAGALTFQVTPLVIDADGVVLASARCWLGDLQLATRDAPTSFHVDMAIPYRTADETRGPAFYADNRRPYIHISGAGIPGRGFSSPDPDLLLLFAPQEPLPKGAPLPRALTLNLSVTPRVWAMGGSSGQIYDEILFDQEFTWTLPLPQEPTVNHIAAYRPPGHPWPPFSRSARGFTLQAVLADARARQYRRQGDLDRAIYWTKQAIAGARSATSNAQFQRLELASLYRDAGDLQKAAQVFREVIAVHERHPETGAHHRKRAEFGLARLGLAPRDERRPETRP